MALTLAAPVTRRVEARCIGCGCTDSQACFGGCYWLQVRGDKGVCSSCPRARPRFRELVAKANDRRCAK